MNLQQRYKLFDPTIASEIFDNEVVIVNLLSGIYYSLTGSATEVWVRLTQGYSQEEMVKDLQKIYEVGTSSNAIGSDVDGFIQTLLEHSLIAEDPEAEQMAVPVTSSAPGKYAQPTIDVFQDMQDILLLDPVHDVNDLGWPTKISAPSSQ